MDKIQKPADRAKYIWMMKFPTFSISLSLSSYELKCPYQNTKATTMLLSRWSIG